MTNQLPSVVNAPWLEDSHDAMMVAQALDIPFQSIDLSKEYKERIVDYMFAEYEQRAYPQSGCIVQSGK